MDKEAIIKNLNKLGDTPFKLKNIEFEIFEEGFLRVSSINSVRRELIEDIMKYVKIRDERHLEEKDYKEFNRNSKEAKDIFNDEYLICVKTLEQLKSVLRFIGENPDITPAIGVDLLKKGEGLNLEGVDYENLYMIVPNIIKSEFNLVTEAIEKNISKIKGLITANLGIINVFKNRLNIIGDYKLNILNSESYDFYNRYTDISALSVELNNKEMFSIAKNIKTPVQVVVYGKYELMVSEYCVIGSTFGNKSSTSNCNFRCDKDKFVLRDRMNEEFLVTTDKYCRSHIYNTLPVNIVPFIKELRKNNINNYRVDFIDEDCNQVSKVMKYIFKDEDVDLGKTTKGHYKRGIE